MKRRLAGSITLFYACLTLLLISLLGSVMESVRVHTVKSMASDSSYLALQNSLAGYQRELWDDYHILFLDVREIGGEEALEAEIQENLQTSWSPVGEGLLSSGDWMGTSCKASEVTAARYLTEEGGKELLEQSLAYMKYRAVTGMGEMLLEQFDLMKGLKQGKKFLEKKLELEKGFSKLEEKKNQIVRQLQEMEELWKQAEEAVQSIEEKQREWENSVFSKGVQGGALASGESKESNAIVAEATKVTEVTETEPSKGPDILAELDILYRVAGNLSGQGQDVCQDCDGYQNQQQKTVGQKEEYADWLTENRNTLEEHAWEALRAELEELEQCQRGDKEYIAALKGKLRQNETVLLGLQELCQNSMEGPEPISARALLEQLRGYQSQLLPDHYQLPSGGTTKGSPFAALREFASKGVLALVLPAGSEISEQVLKPADWQKQDVSDTADTGVFLKELTDQVLLLEYNREHFGCYTALKEETALCYEQEYLLIGSSKDRENLTGVVSELLAVRTMADFLQLLTKPEKVAQARQMAAAIAGVTGSSALVPVIKTGILLLWAVQDAIAEVKELMQGGKAALYSDISSLSLDYQGYLWLLQMVGQPQGLRMARLIEGTIQKRYQNAFQATDCAAALCMTLTAELKPHFFRNRLWRITKSYKLGYVH